jgi:LytR cell envelope-related transcriptional attenuator
MDLIEQIGPFLGIAAFLGLSILAFLLFQQSRDLRRLREWAGRAPERAEEAAEAALAAAEARGEATDATADAEGEPGAVRQFAGRVRQRLVDGWTEVDRRLPVDARIVAAVLVAAVVAVGVLTSGFGLVGDDAAPERAARSQPLPPERRVDVAVLNATQAADVAAVPGLAATVSEAVVRPLDYNIVVEGDAPSGEPQTGIMYAPGQRSSAVRLARQVREDLGATEIARMSPEVTDAARDADLALLIGLDNSTFGQ